MRYALINISTKLVVNVVEMVDGDNSSEPTGFIHVQSDTGNIGDSWDGTSIVPKPVPPREPRE